MRSAYPLDSPQICHASLPVRGSRPVTALIIDTGYKPHEHQLKVHEGAKRLTVVVTHRRFGKTFLAVNTLLHGALASTAGNAVFAYLAPFLR